MDNKTRSLNSNLGFTLLESVIVVMVLSIGAAVTAFSINQMMPDIRIKSAVRDLKSDMNRARITAVRENRAVTMLFDWAGEKYTYFIDNGAGDGEPADGKQEGDEPILKTVELPKGINLYDSEFGLVDYLMFNGLGRAQAGGHVYMRNNKDDFRGVSVQTIGKVNIQVSSGGSDWACVK